MIDMPPLRLAEINGVRLGFYDAGPAGDKPPMVLCHGWPEIAFTWRRQIKALSEAGIRTITPDQRGFGAPLGQKALGSGSSERGHHVPQALRRGHRDHGPPSRAAVPRAFLRIRPDA